MSFEVSYSRDRKFGTVVLALALVLFLFIALFHPVGATPPETLDFNLDVQIGGAEGVWNSSGLVSSSGYGDFDPWVKGWFDPTTGQFAVVHDRMTLIDDHGTITIYVHGYAATVTDDQGCTQDCDHEGFAFHWNILSSTGEYSDLYGQGAGYGWPDFTTFRFTVHLSGQGHFDP